MNDFPLRGFVYKRKQYFSSFENISTIVSIETNGSTRLSDNGNHLSSRRNSMSETNGETVGAAEHWPSKEDQDQDVQSDCDREEDDDEMEESSYASAYRSRLETLKMIAQLRPRRQRVRLTWTEDQNKDQKKHTITEEQSGGVCTTANITRILIIAY